jgi:hypothetical protein
MGRALLRLTLPPMTSERVLERTSSCMSTPAFAEPMVSP